MKKAIFDLQGHRGCRGLMPENTIPAFIMALDIGVTTLELDVVISMEHLVIVSHDPWISSMICLHPDGSEISSNIEKELNIYHMNYDEIKSFDCGSLGHPKFPDQQKLETRKPTLVEVLETCENHISNQSLTAVNYNIELKITPETDHIFHPGPEKFAELVYHAINECIPWKRITIQSFDARILRIFNTKYPDVRLALLVENGAPMTENLDNLGFKPDIYSPYFELLDQKTVEMLHQRQIRVIPWTVNEISDMKKMIDMGVDGLITDYPNRFWDQKFGAPNN